MSLEAPQVQQKSDILKKIRIENNEDTLAHFKLSEPKPPNVDSQSYEPMDQDKDYEIHEKSSHQQLTSEDPKVNGNDSGGVRRKEGEFMTNNSLKDEGNSPSSEEIDKASIKLPIAGADNANNEMEDDNNYQDEKVKEEVGVTNAGDENIEQMKSKEEGQPEPETLASCAEGNGSDVPPPPESAEPSHPSNSIDNDHHQHSNSIVQNRNSSTPIPPRNNSPHSDRSGTEHRESVNCTVIADEKSQNSQLQKLAFQEIQTPPAQQHQSPSPGNFRHNYRLNNNNNNNNNLNNNHIKGKIGESAVGENLPVINLSSLQHQRGVIHYNPMGPSQDKRKNCYN